MENVTQEIIEKTTQEKWDLDKNLMNAESTATRPYAITYSELAKEEKIRTPS